MRKNLQFDFLVDKKNNTMHVLRDFDADLDLVWQAWTRAELLNQWWAPKPYRVQTKQLEFMEGGTWLYAMVSPEDEYHWCKADYQAIKPLDRFSFLDAFCDEEGVENTGKPRSHWTNVFTEAQDKTTVSITIQQESLADLEMMLKMGFREGFTMGLGNLDEVLRAYPETS